MELKELQEKIKELLAKDVSAKIEKVKGGGDKEYNYLSWAWCFTEVMKIDAHFSYKVLENSNGMPYWFDEDLGYIVKTEMTILGITRTMWLPVMDSRNYSMKNKPYEVKTKYNTYKVEQASMFDVNKAIMRCLVKNVAMCIGLGLYIYGGEDVPEAIEDTNEVKVEIIEPPKKQTKKKNDKVEGFTDAKDLPFPQIEVQEKEQSNYEALMELQDLVAKKCEQVGKKPMDCYAYYSKQWKEPDIFKFTPEQYQIIIDQLDRAIAKRGN